MENSNNSLHQELKHVVEVTIKSLVAKWAEEEFKHVLLPDLLASIKRSIEITIKSHQLEDTIKVEIKPMELKE